VHLELGVAFWLQFAEPCIPRHVEIARDEPVGASTVAVRGVRYQIAHRATTPTVRAGRASDQQHHAESRHLPGE